MNLDFGRCQVYKLNISACLTERELDYYNLFCDGITRKELKKRLGVDYPTSEMLSEEFHISLEDAADLLKAQMNKKCFRKFLTDEIEKFSPNEVREIRKSAIYVADEEGNLTDRIKDNKKIVWFGNECVRRCNVDLKDIPLLDQFLLLKCGSKALTGVLNQIVERGVNLDGKHYLFYTSTTGQMKETEITLVEEEYWKENEYALMCGLTEERINSKGGINMGKYFAAKALNLSNSIKYDSGISIDEVIIVPDFKTFVSGMVNYLDVNTLDIQEKKMEIEIEHMDGAGIFIPGTFPCSCQIRGGWLKGAVFPFDFHKFIEKYRDKVSAANMIDAWGNPVTVEEFLNAKMILTDSQLKMRKYYDSMQEYRKCFKKAKLSITVNNCAHQAKSEVKVAYQPFQTIPRDNLTDETIKKLADKTVRYIEDAKKNPKAALQLMGIEIDSEDMEDKMKDVEMNVLHAAILKYPQLLNDIHVQKIMKSVLLSERRKAQGCKLVLDGFWSYICPDLYAFCQWLFLGQDVPEGLVPNGYIYNHYDGNISISAYCSRCHWNENVVGNVFDGKSLREMITEWNYRTPLTCDEACELEEFRMLNDLKEKSERRDFYSKIGGTELSEEKIEKATFGKEFEIFYLENYRLKLHERVPALTTDEIENISIYALDLVRSKKEMSEEEYKNAEREMDIEISRMAFEHLYDDIKEVHERLPYLTPEECQEWFDCWKRWSAFQDNKLWNILTFDYVMRGWKLEELNDQREKNMSSLFDYIVLGNQEGKIKDGSE